MEAKIVGKTNNVFLWVVIMVSLLNKIYDEGRIEGMKRILEEIPDGLERLFSTILGQDIFEKAVTILMLQLVFFSRETFTVKELFAAVIKIPFPNREIINRRITISSKSLIEIFCFEKKSCKLLIRIWGLSQLWLAMADFGVFVGNISSKDLLYPKLRQTGAGHLTKFCFLDTLRAISSFMPKWLCLLTRHIFSNPAVLPKNHPLKNGYKGQTHSCNGGKICGFITINWHLGLV
ncbi:hypothetical protein PoMZ_06117 [Pyricularia oryzae]|uniref:Uncharacterized protein n=1 Tax=Pyricularia oryzae TaxID=318829 RepID=A0A4P7NQ83_PYROR|nr:hypothetical protein PoMZ_06117 [Pyricularia oryzae]